MLEGNWEENHGCISGLHLFPEYMIVALTWTWSMQLLGENINGQNKLFGGQKGRNRAGD